MLSFKSAFSLFAFTFIKRLFSSSSLSAIRVVSPAFLRLLIFLPAILIPPYEVGNICLPFMGEEIELRQGNCVIAWDYTALGGYDQVAVPHD